MAHQEFSDVSEPYAIAQLERLSCHADGRGHLVELFRDDEVTGYADVRMGYLSVTDLGVVRGPHEHAQQTDRFIFCRSRFTVFLWRGCRRQKILVPDDGYYRLFIGPGVVHAYRAESPNAVVINLPDELYAGWHKAFPVDEVRHENDLESPYQLW